MKKAIALILISISTAFIISASSHAAECIVDTRDLMNVRQEIQIRPLRAVRSIDNLISTCQNFQRSQEPIVVAAFAGSFHIQTPFPRTQCNLQEMEFVKNSALEDAVQRCTLAGHLNCVGKAAAIRVNGTFLVGNFTKQGCIADASAQAIQLR